MHRRPLAIVVLVTLGLASGCAPKPTAKPQAALAPPITSAPAATALCFDPPVTGSIASADLDRDGRGVEAFLGYTTQTTEAYVIRTNDRQLFYNNPSRSGRFGGGSDFSQYDRQSYSERSGLLLR